MSGRTNKDNVVTDTDDMNIHLQVDSQRFPDQPTTGVAEHYAGPGQRHGPWLDLTDAGSVLSRQSSICHQSGACGGNEGPLSGIWTVVGDTPTRTVNFSGNAVRHVNVFKVVGLLGNIRKGQLT